MVNKVGGECKRRNGQAVTKISRHFHPVFYPAVILHFRLSVPHVILDLPFAIPEIKQE